MLQTILLTSLALSSLTFFNAPSNGRVIFLSLRSNPAKLVCLLVVQIVENVILDLESLAQALRVSPDSLHLFFRSAHGHCPGSRGSDEQRRRLVVDYLVVILFQRVPGIGFLELKQLTLSEIGSVAAKMRITFAEELALARIFSMPFTSQ